MSKQKFNRIIEKGILASIFVIGCLSTTQTIFAVKYAKSSVFKSSKSNACIHRDNMILAIKNGDLDRVKKELSKGRKHWDFSDWSKGLYQKSLPYKPEALRHAVNMLCKCKGKEALRTQEKILKKIINAGAYSAFGGKCLETVIKSGASLELCEIFLDVPGVINECDKNILTEGGRISFDKTFSPVSMDEALVFAVKANRSDVVKMLLNKGANVTASCFEQAISNPSKAVLEQLLTANQDHNIADTLCRKIDSESFFIAQNESKNLEILVETFSNHGMRFSNETIDLVQINKLKTLILEENIKLIRNLVEKRVTVTKECVSICIDKKNMELLDILLGGNIERSTIEDFAREIESKIEKASEKEKKQMFNSEYYNKLLDTFEKHGISFSRKAVFIIKGDTSLKELENAIQTKNFDKVKSLIESGVNINTKINIDSWNHDASALYYAVKEKNMQMIQWLVEHGADITMGNSDDPVHLAARNGDYEIFKYLSSKIKSYSRYQKGFYSCPYTVLSSAIEGENKQIIYELMDKNVGLQIDSPYDPLVMAVARGDKDLIYNLMEKLKKRKLKISNEVYFRAVSAEENYPGTLKFVLDNGNPDIITTVNSEGNTLLHEAASLHFCKALKILLERGINPNVLNAKGRTPMKLAKDFNFDPAQKTATLNLLAQYGGKMYV